LTRTNHAVDASTGRQQQPRRRRLATAGLMVAHSHHGRYRDTCIPRQEFT